MKLVALLVLPTRVLLLLLAVLLLLSAEEVAVAAMPLIRLLLPPPLRRMDPESEPDVEDVGSNEGLVDIPGREEEEEPNILRVVLLYVVVADAEIPVAKVNEEDDECPAPAAIDGEDDGDCCCCSCCSCCDDI
jgi:hypothetical protein